MTMNTPTKQKAGRRLPMTAKRPVLIRFRLPLETIRRLDRVARTLEISRSDVIRMAIGSEIGLCQA